MLSGLAEPAERFESLGPRLKSGLTGEYKSSEELQNVRNRPESPGIAAISPGKAAVISRRGLNCILAKFSDNSVKL